MGNKPELSPFTTTSRYDNPVSIELGATNVVETGVASVATPVLKFFVIA